MITKQHLIAIDLDGTLLTDEKTMTDKSKQVLAKVIEAGHKVVIATGRPHYASLNYYHELGLDTPIVNFNGAYLHHPREAKWDALHSPLPIRTAKEIVQFCYDLGVRNLMADMLGSILLDHFDQDFVEIFNLNMEDTPLHIGKINNLLDEDPTSLIIHAYDHQLEALQGMFDNDHAEVIEHHNWGAPWHIIEIIRKGMNKGVAVSRLAKYYDIEPENVIAFGDQFNDLEMLDFAGVGVAMENAIDPLKKIATHQTKKNTENGVALFLEDYFKIN